MFRGKFRFCQKLIWFYRLLHHKIQYTLNYFINFGDLLKSLHSYFVQRKFVSIKKKKIMQYVIMNDIKGKYIPFISNDNSDYFSLVIR